MLILYGLLVLGLLVLVWWGVGQFDLLPNAHRLAERRAEQLLRQHITAGQYRQLQEEGYIDIASRLYARRIYRVFRRRQRVQVFLADDVNSQEPLRKLGELCVIARDPVPDADLFLAHKWMIEADEQSYLLIANRMPYPVVW